ncbi:S-adenosyl-L-methionine-dependent methyltransferase [Mycotypha africana]|uniref:S-adenosyl-L-methionine-dependent methyltransferase n=1 Tax=Mycotypha africana TaxID=64632 RepID=UPI00230077EF|nr:S-adenosyl-L-methionine-dependent methyltransferase [Mycotypha africana]KAI8982274.1 S-adenosyl-L-methionine-dependent methyltransferase [Mycotypha africana]
MAYSRKKRGANRNKSENGKRSDDAKGSYAEIQRDNANFKNYYQQQNILSPEEFEEFYSHIKTILPSTFRITGSRAAAMEILKVVQETYVPSMQNIVIDDVKIEPPKPLPWYPENLGWQVNAPRLVIRKSPEFQKFHRFIVAETEAGNISRQEAVSMVPPLLMDIKPHQWVLDMCAAPGSKTAQIIEAVHSNDKLNEMPTGLVVANDADYKRSHMLVHQSKRLQSPCFMATNHDGAHFPNLHVPMDDSEINTRNCLPWQFDRVLCDVPCSGDGTIRKNEKIWREWSPGNALQLHTTQVQIFSRGCQLVKMGGRIVYSTCSFNPIENEAVVAEVLRQTKGAIRLVDVSSSLPELKRKPGLHTWKVSTRDGKRFINSLDDLDEKHRRKFPTTVFPPTAEEAKEMHLERCLRIYPHLQDTGGFFVAVFEKVGPLTPADRLKLARQLGQEVTEKEVKEAEKKEQEEEEKTAMDDDNVGEEVTPSKRGSQSSDTEDLPSKKAKTDSTNAQEEKDEEEDDFVKPYEGKPKKDVPGIKEAPFELMHPDSPDFDIITDFYGLDAKFPRDQFLLRSDNNAKGRSLYFVSSAVKRVLQAQDFPRLQIVNTGVRLFVRQSSPSMDEGGACPFRLTSEGLPILNDVLSDKRRIIIGMDTLKVLLVEAFPIIDEFPEHVRAELNALTMGSCIAHIDPTKGTTAEESENHHFSAPLILPVWKGRNSLNVLLHKIDKRALCQRIFGIIPGSTPQHLIERSSENQALRDERDAAAAAATAVTTVSEEKQQ